MILTPVVIHLLNEYFFLHWTVWNQSTRFNSTRSLYCMTQIKILKFQHPFGKWKEINFFFKDQCNNVKLVITQTVITCCHWCQPVRRFCCIAAISHYVLYQLSVLEMYLSQQYVDMGTGNCSNFNYNMNETCLLLYILKYTAAESATN